MENKTISEFIDNYSSDSFERIEFDWNGKHAGEFVDRNIDFRNKVCDEVLRQIDKVNIELIRDLYLEDARCAKEAWGAPRRLAHLGQEILRRGRTKYVMDYLAGASLSMDTNIMSGQIELDKQIAKEILEYIELRLASETDELNKKLIQHIGLRRFGWLANKE